MDFRLTEEQKMFRDMVRDFAKKEVEPGASERDKKAEFAHDLVKEMGELGLMGVFIPEEFGGSGGDVISYLLAVEELAKVDPGVAVTMSVNNSVCCFPILKFGNEEQKKKYLPLLASGEVIGGFCLTEPNAGSDAGSLRTKAVKKGDKYIINGSKAWITNARVGKYFVLLASTNPEAGHKGISAFIVDADHPGFIVDKPEDKMGMRSSKTCMVTLEDLEVPAENLLGEEGMGFKIALTTLNHSRIGIGAQALGIAKGAFEEGVKYSTERVQFGKPIAKQQAIQFKIADMATRIEAAENLVYYAGFMDSIGKTDPKLSSMAKMYASETAIFCTYEALQIHGGYGYSKEYKIERLYRDARVTTIYEGTNEIQRLVIAKSLLG
ncbi:acyl-CoA dehydrogenase [Thermotomaculum hydrothermale]|uniref:Cyclohex-1-ene-1-carbonyl-CoA dehydrogenase n=1 Tax=Thermotomaculum hydrothermale TaxID=981385 RepID=A0A7R6PMC8_9BACT|nr:acyl-CoA dehydrogenase [Thermotomaculum hydrothermale]BBB32213.1 acyl-CoA dehydrogenase [Thermotomaculum hydrothermale]